MSKGTSTGGDHKPNKGKNWHKLGKVATKAERKEIQDPNPTTGSSGIMGGKK